MATDLSELISLCYGAKDALIYLLSVNHTYGVGAIAGLEVLDAIRPIDGYIITLILDTVLVVIFPTFPKSLT